MENVQHKCQYSSSNFSSILVFFPIGFDTRYMFYSKLFKEELINRMMPQFIIFKISFAKGENGNQCDAP